MRRPSSATLISIVALFFAVGTGGGYAAGVLVGSAQIKDGSIRLADLSPALVAALRGSSGGVDPAKLTSAISVPPTVVQPGAAGTATATCPAGSAAVSGGGFGDIAGINASQPVTHVGDSYPTGWYIAVLNNETIPVKINAAVVCLAR